MPQGNKRRYSGNTSESNSDRNSRKDSQNFLEENIDSKRTRSGGRGRSKLVEPKSPKKKTSKTDNKASKSQRKNNQTGLNNNATPEVSSLNEIETGDHVTMAVDPVEETALLSDEEDNSDHDEVLPCKKVPLAGRGRQQQSLPILDDETEVSFKNPHLIDDSNSSIVEEELTEGDMEKLTQHPVFAKYIQKIVAKEVQKEKQIEQDKGGASTSKRNTSGTQNTPDDRGNNRRGNNLFPYREPVKSPSDTKIYAPALQRLTPKNNVTGPTDNEISNFIQGIRITTNQHGRASVSPDSR